MELSIQLLYNEVLSELPFSLTGHADFEDKLNKFYTKLAESRFIQNSGITLLFSAVLDIPYNIQEINDWNLKSFHNIFYKTIGENNKQEAISFYFHMLKWASEKIGHPKLSTSLILSKFFISDANFRVALHDQADPFVHYNPDTWCFEILMPANLFKKFGDASTLLKLKLELDKIWNGKEIYLENNEQLFGIYKIKERLNDENHCSQVFDKIFETNKIDNIILSIEDQLKSYYIYNGGKDLYIFDTTLFKDIAYCSICLSFLCWYYDSKIEYMLSIAKSDSSPNNLTKIEHRNIGGLVIGYRSELNELPRAIFNLISDRISAAVGGQHLVESNRKAKVVRARLRFNQFCAIINDRNPDIRILNEMDAHQIHGNRSFEIDSISKISSLIDKYTQYLGKDFVKYFTDNSPVFSKYLTILCSRSKQFSGEVNECFKQYKCRFRKTNNDCDCIYCRLIRTLSDEEETVGYYLNLPLLDNFVTTFEKYSKTSFSEILIIEDKIVLKYTHQINMPEFLEILNTARSRSFTGFIRDNILPILSLGGVSITDIDNVEKFNLEDWFVLGAKYVPAQQISLLSGFHLIFTLKHKL